MSDAPFQFDLYRLVVIDDPTFFDFVGKPVAADDQIKAILAAAASPEVDQTVNTSRSVIQWSLREYDELPENVLSIVLARSIVERTGRTVTERGIEDAVSEQSPPLADTIHIFFKMARHLSAVEIVSEITKTDAWRSAFHTMVDAAAARLGFRSSLRLEPVPKEHEILDAFRSFSRLTRLRVHLLLPNPEMSHLTERLRKEMEAGGIREYIQDMKSPRGLSQSDNALPFAAAAMAQAGYKTGEVVMEGIQNSRRTKVRTGRRAARGTVDRTKDFVRGMTPTLRTKEARAAVAAIMEEIDRVAEPPSSTSP